MSTFIVRYEDPSAPGGVGSIEFDYNNGGGLDSLTDSLGRTVFATFGSVPTIAIRTDRIVDVRTKP